MGHVKLFKSFSDISSFFHAPEVEGIYVITSGVPDEPQVTDFSL